MDIFEGGDMHAMEGGAEAKQWRKGRERKLAAKLWRRVSGKKLAAKLWRRVGCKLC
jgi:hypothetical protein